MPIEDLLALYYGKTDGAEVIRKEDRSSPVSWSSACRLWVFSSNILRVFIHLLVSFSYCTPALFSFQSKHTGFYQDAFFQ